MRVPYQYGTEAVAATPFTYLGKTVAKGKPFMYRELGIIDLDLHGLWRAEKIEFTGKPYPTAPEKPVQSPGASAPAAPPVPMKAAAPAQQAQRR